MRRWFSSSIKHVGVRLLPMPKLSPSMVSGKVEKWRIKPGDQIQPYQLILEISTESLLKIGIQKDIMDIEIIEDAYLAKILVNEGESIRVGGPIAIFCEEKQNITSAAQIQVYLTHNK